MKFNKSVIALLCSSLILGTMTTAPMVGFAQSSEPSSGLKRSNADTDWAVVNEEALIKSLKDRGKLSKDASPEEIEKAVQNYVSRGKTPFSKTDGIDTSSSFGKRAFKNRRAFQKKMDKKVAGFKEESTKKTGKNHFSDNAVVALIEFPDLKHNQIPPNDDGTSLWTKDFSPEHYQKLLFSKDGYTTDDGKKLISFTQYYQQQSAGYWSISGKITPWIEAQHNAAYYGEHIKVGDYEDNDARPRDLVKETLTEVGKLIAGHESEYDQRDPYDLDGDGNVMEPDGLLDNLMIVHSGMGEEAGGGQLGPDAIWSHRSVIGQAPVPIPGTKLKAYDYIIQPEDGAAGVFAHEYGHNLGLPDEYDTGYTGSGSPVEAWSIMSYGSWAGKVPGTEPTGFSPYDKLFFHETYGGNWPVPTVIDFKNFHGHRTFPLKEAVANTKRGKMLKIDLPDRLVDPPTQPLGKKSYFSTKGNSLDTSMTSPVIDLTNAKSPKLSFDSWRDIEANYDYLYLKVKADGADQPVTVKEYTDSTDGKWVNDQIDLTPFAGKKIQLTFEYVTDIGLAKEGFYVDNIDVSDNGQTLFHDDAEGTPQFTLDGFKVFDGSKIPFPNYYLVEWRNHNGVDQGLAHIRRNNSFLVYNPGMLVWYYDGRWGDDNMTGLHPGEGFLGLVDAHQFGFYWNDGTVGSTRYQLADAAFGWKSTVPIDITYPDSYMKYDSLPGVPVFFDGNDYSSPYNPDGGKILPYNGVKLVVKKANRNDSEAWVELSKVK
ncbi:immune inhibitor A domain-containing protein [Thermoactinomyces sp. CICC 10522]|uniref:immune inhibitor A domain-containing protein n=1 Tax=Thermoactinomyces sp. CICC 10522 TaxID=2767427 RepID=UPI0018DC387C|nr:immune inhibitor A domain-containing protein [Thermoactinomyces sp. CICC 10522]MBH8603450.1 immune inhibitor A [Thermoactinomyces sp. CICC 10522]